MRTVREIKRVLVTLLTAGMVLTSVPVDVFASGELIADDIFEEVLSDEEPSLTDDQPGGADELAVNDGIILPEGSEELLDGAEISEFADMAEVETDESIISEGSESAELNDPGFTDTGAQEQEGSSWNGRTTIHIADTAIEEVSYKLNSGAAHTISDNGVIECGKNDILQISVTKVADGYENHEYRIGSVYYKFNEWSTFAASRRVNSVAQKFTGDVYIRRYATSVQGRILLSMDVKDNVFDQFDYEIYDNDNNRIGEPVTLSVDHAGEISISYNNAKYISLTNFKANGENVDMNRDEYTLDYDYGSGNVYRVVRNVGGTDKFCDFISLSDGDHNYRFLQAYRNDQFNFHIRNYDPAWGLDPLECYIEDSVYDYERECYVLNAYSATGSEFSVEGNEGCSSVFVDRNRELCMVADYDLESDNRTQQVQSLGNPCQTHRNLFVPGKEHRSGWIRWNIRSCECSKFTVDKTGE